MFNLLFLFLSVLLWYFQWLLLYNVRMYTQSQAYFNSKWTLYYRINTLLELKQLKNIFVRNFAFDILCSNIIMVYILRMINLLYVYVTEIAPMLTAGIAFLINLSCLPFPLSFFSWSSITFIDKQWHSFHKVFIFFLADFYDASILVKLPLFSIQNYHFKGPCCLIDIARS